MWTKNSTFLLLAQDCSLVSMRFDNVCAALLAALPLLVVEAAQSQDVLPVLIIPGYASTQLHAWRSERCGALGQEVSIGDRVWVNVAHLLAQKECWLRCMSLKMEDQSDIGCKLRAGEGISSIAELAPGMLTGPMSIVWRNVIETLTGHFDLSPHQLMVASYDWRLPPYMLQERDHYYYTMRQKIEDAVVQNQCRGIVVLAHSLGNHVFRYFLEWLRLQIPSPDAYQTWVDTHIVSYFSVGAPFLGSAETIEVLTTGATISVPVAKESLRQLQVNFGSTQWMLPFPRDVADPKANKTLITVQYMDDAVVPTVRNYSMHDITSGKFHRELKAVDPLFHTLDYLYQKFYAQDPILNPHTPWPRPPIKSVYVVYGTGLPVRDFYKLTRTAAGTWETTAATYEVSDPHTCTKAGDGTVSYDSLAWGHTWLGPPGTEINITRIPQAPFFDAHKTTTTTARREHYSVYAGETCHTGQTSSSSDSTNTPVQSTNSGFLSDMMWSRGVVEPKVNFYEYKDSASHVRTFDQTSVWELDQVPHREILTDPSFLRELKHELQLTFATGSVHATKTFRPPHHDSDCYWNYLRAQCEFSEYCQYDYKFGDVTLDQSCRIKRTRDKGKTTAVMQVPATSTSSPTLARNVSVAGHVFKHLLFEFAAQCCTPDTCMKST
ncbi:Aste57867_391 [Aphanomyces stellatus]|uniref:Aste57867_391 protein n=1 Tax=Aphanomyces stellatus TaxID=120398 RepID=A0A485K3N9_9STRA|nr:hypothetical protein As57867_000390 [Aphanomyces stellatus]VFT77616.1 Aste57867_391 [Aphanomyces stellatus]